MKKFIITEEEKQRIRTLHEQTWFKDKIVNPIKSFSNKDQGVGNPEVTAPETEKKDMVSYEKLVNEPAKQEGGKYTAWGMGMSPDMATAKKIAIQNANTKIKKAGQVGGWYDTEKKVFQENGNYYYFIKMST